MADRDPHKAPDKKVVDKVIDTILSGGGGLVTLLSGLLAAVLIIYSGYVLYDTFHTQQQASSSAWDLLQYKPEIIDDMETPLYSADLSAINADYRAWLTVYDTNIDYPVVQGTDDLYYASHDIYNRTSLTGAIYLAAGNSPNFSDSYNLIYGHHMDIGAMLGGLDPYITDASYFESHRTGVVVTKTGVFDIEFIAALTTDAYENRIYTVGNRMGDVLSFLRSGGEGGIGVGTKVKIFDAEAAKDATKLVALSTCANASTNGRLVIIGKLTEHIVTTDLSVAKVWDDADNQDGKRPPSITARLMNGADVVETVTLSAENDWTATVTVRKFANYLPIDYRWEEVLDGETAQHYTLTNTETDENGKTTFTNSHTPETVTVNVRKVWDDDNNRDGIRQPSVSVNLLADGTAVENAQGIILSAATEWKASVPNLPVYSGGKKIAYTWTENPVSGYTANIAPGETSEYDTVVTNVHAPARIDLPVRKVWEDAENQDGKRPETLTVNLYGGETLVETKALSEANSWTATATGLYVNENGQPIRYHWTEQSLESLGYASDGGKDVEGVFTFTNSRTPETVDITLEKVWNDDNNRDALRDELIHVTLSNGDRHTLTAEDNWKLTVEDLPKYANGQEIQYTWTEDEVSGYTLTSNVTNGTSTVLTNYHETTTTVATVLKRWEDAENQDGKRTSSVTVTLLANGEEVPEHEGVKLNAGNKWKYTATGLPLKVNGQDITYTWREENIPDGYTCEPEINGTTTTLVNTHVPETVDLTVSKGWDDEDNRDGIRPPSVMAVLSDGTTCELTAS